MLRTVNSFLLDANALPKHKVWVEYFQKHQTISKDFLKHYPEFSKYSQFLAYKGFDSVALKKCVSGVSSTEALETKLVNMYHLNDPIPAQILPLILDSHPAFEGKYSDKHLRIVFDCIFRYFICFAYQIPNSLNADISIISYISVYIDFMLKFKNCQRFQSVITIFSSIFNDFEKNWTRIFSMTAGCPQQLVCLQFLCFLPPLTESLIQIYKNFDSFNFTLLRLSDVVKLIPTNLFAVAILQPLATILSSFSDLISVLETKEKIDLCRLTNDIIANVGKYTCLKESEQYQLGVKCMDLYSKSSVAITDDLAVSHFNVIISYSLWIISTFPDNQSQSGSNCVLGHRKETIEEIGLQEYLKTAETIPESPPLVSNTHLQQSALLLAETCHSSKNEAMLISLLLKSLRDHESDLKDLDEYKSFAAFILYILYHCDDKVLCDGFSHNWDILLSPNLFPVNIVFQVDKNLRDTVLYILMRCFISVQSSRLPIFASIGDYLNRSGIEAIYVFLPLFNSLLLIDSETKFATELIKSPLMNFLLNESSNLDTFDLLRNLIYVHPSTCFESRTILVFCFDKMENPMYQESMLQCLENALNVCAKIPSASPVLSSLICTLSSSIDSFLVKNVEIARKLIEILSQSSKLFNSEVVHTLFLASTFEIFARAILVLDSYEVFTLVLETFTFLCIKDHSVLLYFLKKDCQVYSILSTFCQDKTLDFDAEDSLYQFLLQDTFNNRRTPLIRNFRVVPLIFEWAKGRANEAEYYNHLLDVSALCTSNLYELVRSETSSLILRRIEELGFNDITRPLFKLYCMICNLSFPTSVFYDTLNLIGNPNFDYPQEFTQFFSSHLDVPKKYESTNSYFHFDGEDGILGPTDFNFGSHFGFFALIRNENTISKQQVPFLQFISDQNESLRFSFEDLYLRYERTGSQVLSSTFSTKFDHEFQWVSIFIEISPTRITLFVDNKMDSTEIPNTFPKQSISFTAKIGNGFRGDISDIYILNDCFKPPFFSLNPVCHYSPRAVSQNMILNVCPNQEVRFLGKPILFVNSIFDDVKTATSISNLLVLFKRLLGCPACQSEVPKRCKVCGSLNGEDGSVFFVSLLKLFGKISHFSEQLITERRYMLILSDYLIRMKQFYFKPILFDCLLDMFKNANLDEFKAEMIESFWLNLDFFSVLPTELKLPFFDKILPQAYSIQPSAFNQYPNFNVIYQLAVSEYSDNSDLSIAVWRFLFSIVPERSDFASFSLLLTIPMFHDFDYAVVSSIKCIESLTSKKNQLFSKILENVDNYLPFSYIMQIPKIDLQISALNIISHINQNLGSNHFPSAIYHSIACYRPSENSVSLLHYITNIFISTSFDNKMTIACPEFFPLLTVISCLIPKEDSINSYHAFVETIKRNQSEAQKMGKIENWQFWLYRYVSQYYDISDRSSENIGNFISPFVLIFESQLCSDGIGFSEAIENLFLISVEESDNAAVYFIHAIVNSIYNDARHETAIITKGGVELITITFVQLFYRIKCTRINGDSSPPFVSKFSFMDRFCWFPTLFTFKSHFALNCSENGTKWLDLEMAENIISLMDLFCEFEVKLSNLIIEGVTLFTYITVILMRFSSRLVERAVARIAMLLDNANEETRHLCASMILRTYFQMNGKVTDPNLDLTPFHKMVTNFIDIDDSDAYQLFLFETTLCEQSTQIDKTKQKRETEFVINVRKVITDTLKLGQVPNDTPATVNGFFGCISSSAFISLNAIFNDLMKQQVILKRNERKFREQHVKSFENELKALKSDNFAIHFKAINRISQSGRRTLLSIDYNFNDHKAASLMRDFGNKIIEDMNDNETRVKYSHLKVPRSMKNDVFRSQCRMMTPHRDYLGEIIVTDINVIFNGNTETRVKHVEFENSSILFVMDHINKCADISAEVFTNINRSYLFVFENNQRKNFYASLAKVCSTSDTENTVESKYNFFLSLRKAYGQIYPDKKKKLSDIVVRSELTEKWQNREITNYEYIYYLNLLAGRSFNDTSKYPIFPVILMEEGEQLDLSNRTAYRDLSKPVGALGKERLESLLINYREMDEPREKCLYRTHFSNSMIVCSYLIRIEPFTSLHIQYQDKKFDKASRLFSFWKVSLKDTADFRELIPEFFSFPLFLLNANHFDFGENVDDVVLPKWAKSADHFVQMHRRAIESDIVSESINKWVDLMFGIYRNSIEALNVFHPNTYLDNEPETPELEILVENHIQHVGCYPIQLFLTASPSRTAFLRPTPLQTRLERTENVIRIRKEIIICENMTVFNVATSQTAKVDVRSFGDIIEVSRSLNLVIFGHLNDALFSVFDIKTNLLRNIKIKSAMLQCLTVIGGRYLAAGLSDCSVRIWSLPAVKELRVSSYHLSSVVAIAGNFEVGLIVSYDMQNKLIFELLFETSFIRSVTLQKTELPPLLAVFKSGKVAVILREAEKTVIKFFTVNGDLLGQTVVEGCVKEIDKYYDFDQRELLAVAFQPRTISVIDTTTFEILSSVTGSFGSLLFCTVKRKQSILFGSGRIIQSMPIIIQK